MLTAMQAVSLPLTLEFGFTKEIEDRLLSPLPVWMVAIQKIVFAAIRGLVAGAMIFPLGRLILGSAFTVSTGHLGLLALVALLGALGGAALGLTLGTFVQPSQIGLMFSLILTPLLFTGCVYYPWAGLKTLRWFQVVTCFSPLTYASEGFRAALVPQSPHMAVGFHPARAGRLPRPLHHPRRPWLPPQSDRLTERDSERTRDTKSTQGERTREEETEHLFPLSCSSARFVSSALRGSPVIVSRGTMEIRRRDGRAGRAG